MSAARFDAVQRISYRVTHTVVCAELGVSQNCFYKWLDRASSPAASSGLNTARDLRRVAVDRAVRVEFGKARDLHGAPRLVHDLRDVGWRVSVKTVADSMRRQQLIASRIQRRNGLARQDKTAPKFPDLLERDFTAQLQNSGWVGDMTEIPTAAGKLYLATVIDLYCRRMLGAARSLHPDAELACAVIKIAVASRAGVDAVDGPNWREDVSQRVISHRDCGWSYAAISFTKMCRQLGSRQSMGRGRVVWRQRRRRAVLLEPGVGGPLTARAREHRPGPCRRAGLVVRVLHQRPPAQLVRRDETDQLRATGALNREAA